MRGQEPGTRTEAPQAAGQQDSKAGFIAAPEAGDADGRVRLGGDWTLDHLPGLQKALAALDRSGGRSGGVKQSARQSEPASPLRLDASGIDSLDTAGAWAVLDFLDRQRAAGGAEISLDPGAHRSLFDHVDRAMHREAEPVARQPFFLLRWLQQIGAGVTGAGQEAVNLLGFFGHCVTAFFSLILRPGNLRLGATLFHLERAGPGAMPVVGLLSFLIGIVLAYQSAYQLKIFGAEALTVNVLGIGVLREFGILLSAILVAGRSGSAFCAQIGTMKVNEEVDALRTIGMDPVYILVLPRILALVVAMPLLTVFANVAALTGGGLYALMDLDMSVAQFLNRLEAAVGLNSLWVGMVKAPVFGFAIAMTGCHEGLKVAGSADSVGYHTTRAVVVAIFLVILCDALFSILFSLLGI